MTDSKHTSGLVKGLISKPGVATEPSGVSHTFTFFTLSSNILSSSQLHIPERAETHFRLACEFSSNETTNRNSGLTAVFRLLRPETLVPHSLQMGLKVSSAERRHTGSFGSCSFTRVFLQIPQHAQTAQLLVVPDFFRSRMMEVTELLGTFRAETHFLL